jgi:hypothetical protein
MSETLDPHLAAELFALADAAEQAANEDPEAEFPAAAVISQPNRTRMLTLRLRQSEYDTIERAAEAKHLPVSALARSLLLEQLEHTA